jgi:predicted nucleic acid-binding protein
VGLLIDTNVFILAEKSGSLPDFGRWREFGAAFISSITVSELWVGVHKANTAERRRRRAAFVEAVEAAIPALDVTTGVARVHARMLADLPPGTTVGAHDVMIGATARHFDHSVLTENVRDFSRLPGVRVVPLA